jgi:hypothetical protein
MKGLKSKGSLGCGSLPTCGANIPKLKLINAEMKKWLCISTAISYTQKLW